MSKPICLIEDDDIMGESLLVRLTLEGFSCDWYRQGGEALAAFQEKAYGLVISDIRLPDISGDTLFHQLRETNTSIPPFIFITGFADIETAVELLKLGAQDYLTKPFDLDVLVEKVRAILGGAETGKAATLGVSPAMRHIETMLRKLAAGKTSVLIMGESGVGKERVALELHHLGMGNRPFVAVNCGALTETLLEAELFGYEKGAFTGAQRTKKGVFEQADGGTLFLDEIGDMPLSMQIKVLRGIQERRIVRVGGESAIPVDFRLICATHRDLKAMVESGEFREDLYYRITVIRLRIPPLRERKEDILWLAHRLLADLSAQHNGEFFVLQPATERALLDHPWPGNIRELKHALERACVLSEGRALSPDAVFERPARAEDQTEKGLSSLGDYLAESERQFILDILEKHDWQIQICASALGISRKNLWQKMRRLNISR
ncbi:MAG: sigma-54-dependent transcriptional regulator, partial [Sulfuricella sp.]